MLHRTTRMEVTKRPMPRRRSRRKSKTRSPTPGPAGDKASSDARSARFAAWPEQSRSPYDRHSAGGTAGACPASPPPVEAQQCERQGLPRQIRFGRHAGETGSVQQAEQKSFKFCNKPGWRADFSMRRTRSPPRRPARPAHRRPAGAPRLAAAEHAASGRIRDRHRGDAWRLAASASSAAKGAGAVPAEAEITTGTAMIYAFRYAFRTLSANYRPTVTKC